MISAKVFHLDLRMKRSWPHSKMEEL